MAADFVQEIHRLPDLEIDIPDISVTYSGDVSQASKHSGLSGETGLRIYNGEIVKPGVGPGVLIGETRIWRNGKVGVIDLTVSMPLIGQLLPFLNSHWSKLLPCSPL